MSNKRLCPLCGNQTINYNICNLNLQFLAERLNEKTLDESITLARIAWNNFPGLRLTADRIKLYSENESSRNKG